MSDSQVRTRTTNGVSGLALLVTPYAVAAVLLLLAPLGAGWFHVKAVPAAHIPASTLSFGDLRTLTSNPGPVPTNGIQEAYFSWLGWTLIVLTVLLMVATVVLRRRDLALATAAASVLGLVIVVFAVKGPVSWPDFLDQVANIRVGAYLLTAGYLIAIAAPLVARRPGRASR